jgi:hypothetical protein
MIMKWAMSACALAGVVLIASVLVAAAPEPGAAAKEAPAKNAGEKWEYCEVQFSPAKSRVALEKAEFGGFGKGKGKGKGGAGGGPGGAGGAAGGPAPAPAARPAPTPVTWVTGDDEMKAKSWEDLATKMKLPAPKKEMSEAAHRMRVLNYLGRQGWELVSSQQSETSSFASAAGNSVWTFKRKAAK